MKKLNLTLCQMMKIFVIFIIIFVPTKVISQNDSTIVKKSEIRIANQIFAEHSAFSKTISEQKSFIHSLQLINAEEVLKNQRLQQALTSKDSIIYASKKIQEIRDIDCKENIKSAKKSITKAYIITGISTIVTFLVLLR